MAPRRCRGAPRLLRVSAHIDADGVGATITWELSEVATGQVQYGTSNAYGKTSTAETSLDYSTHVQAIPKSGDPDLLPSTTYHYRVVGRDADGNRYVSADKTFTTPVISLPPDPDPIPDPGPTPEPEPPGPGPNPGPGPGPSPGGGTVTYTDYPFTGGDPTGVSDSAAAINAFIQSVPNGADATHHNRVRFDPTAKYRIGTGICTGGKSHLTIWGFAATSSAWIRTDPTVYLDPGTRIVTIPSTAASPSHSAFIGGSKMTDPGIINFDQGGDDVVICGFDIYGHATNPGIFPPVGGNEVHASFESGKQSNMQFCFNRSRGMPGDLVRHRNSNGAEVHHNYVLTTGRMAASFIVNPSLSGSAPHCDANFHHNVIDRAGYWAFDAETEDHPTPAQRYLEGISIHDNVIGTAGFGFFAVEEISQHVHVADISVVDNVVDGYGYGTFGGHRGLFTRINRNLATVNPGIGGVAPSSDPRIQDFTFTGNRVTHTAQTFSGPIVDARYGNGLVVTGNDGNWNGSGNWLGQTDNDAVTVGSNT